LSAAVMPRKSASGTEMIAAMDARKSVLDRRGPIISTTRRERSTPEAARPEKEVPKSPCRTAVIQWK